MLIPQYSIRWLLALMAVCAVIFSVFGLAARGNPWAGGLSVGVLSLAVLLAAHAFCFWLVWAYSVVSLRFRGRRARSAQSPFAQDAIICTGSADEVATNDS